MLDCVAVAADDVAAGVDAAVVVAVSDAVEYWHWLWSCCSLLCCTGLLVNVVLIERQLFDHDAAVANDIAHSYCRIVKPYSTLYDH